MNLYDTRNNQLLFSTYPVSNDLKSNCDDYALLQSQLNRYSLDLSRESQINRDNIEKEMICIRDRIDSLNEERISICKIIRISISMSRKVTETFYMDDTICSVKDIMIVLVSEEGISLSTLQYSENEKEECFILKDNELTIYSEKIKHTKDILIYYKSYKSSVTKNYILTIKENERGIQYRKLHQSKLKPNLFKRIQLRLFSKMVSNKYKI